jgi:hypothetical protein
MVNRKRRTFGAREHQFSALSAELSAPLRQVGEDGE